MKILLVKLVFHLRNQFQFFVNHFLILNFKWSILSLPSLFNSCQSKTDNLIYDVSIFSILLLSIVMEMNNSDKQNS